MEISNPVSNRAGTVQQAYRVTCGRGVNLYGASLGPGFGYGDQLRVTVLRTDSILFVLRTEFFRGTMAVELIVPSLFSSPAIVRTVKLPKCLGGAYIFPTRLLFTNFLLFDFLKFGGPVR